MTTQEKIELLQSKEWQIAHSSLAMSTPGRHTYRQCREYACRSISNGLTQIVNTSAPILEIPKGTDFHFIGRVDTEWCKNDPYTYEWCFKDRNYVSFSTICNKNISHYCNGLFYIYDIHPEDIAHIFPMDSNTYKYSKTEKELTTLPSLWLTLSDLEDLTAELGVYNQVTCRTRRNGQIIWPIAVAAFNEVTDEILEVAKKFKIKPVIIHPDPDAINYEFDLIADDLGTFNLASAKLNERYGFSAAEIIL